MSLQDVRAAAEERVGGRVRVIARRIRVRAEAHLAAVDEHVAHEGRRLDIVVVLVVA